jgi:hypothetical protein
MTTTHTTAQSITSVHRNPIALLDAEWQRMNRSTKVLNRVNSWGLLTTTIGSLDELLQAAGFRGAKCDPVTDQVLAALVRRAASDPLAARIVLQRVIPPIIALAQRRGRTGNIGFDDALGAALSHAWEVIRSYPIARRPIKIAVNIVRDTEYFAFSREGRRRPKHEYLEDDYNGMLNTRSADLFNHEDPYGSLRSSSNSELELAHLLKIARENQVSRTTLAMMESLSTQSLDDFARDHGITRRTAQNWLKGAVNELRVRTQCAA